MGAGRKLANDLRCRGLVIIDLANRFEQVIGARIAPLSCRCGPHRIENDMKRTDIVTVAHKPGDPPLKTSTDWARVAAMTEEEVHAAALSDPDAQPLPRDMRGFTRIPNVKKLREKLSLTQEEFAKTYRIPVGTLRDWEQRRKFPDAPARAFLLVIEKNPEGVAALLNEAA
jgi:putative transcriptional regulator